MANSPKSHLYQHSPIGLMLINRDGLILEYNAMAAEIFGYGLDELLQSHFECLIPESTRSQHSLYFNSFKGHAQGRMMGEGRKSPYFEGLRKNGSTVPIQIGINVTEVDGQRCYALALADVSETLKLNEALRVSNERLTRKTSDLSKLVRQQNHFLNVVSHELRTPLNASFNTLSLLQSTELSESQLMLLQDLDVANSDVARSVRRLMDYADIQLGALDLSTEDVDLLALVLEVSRKVKRLYPDFEDIVELEIDFPINPIIEADRDRLGRLMEGFIENAIKFSKAERIRVFASYSPATLNEPATFKFEVNDNGVGISEELQRNLGKPFANHEDRQRRGSGGMGLGFFLAFRYLELMHGDLTFVTQLGHGTIAGFKCPLQVVDYQQMLFDRTLTFNQAQPYEGLRVLMVEDDPMVHRINSMLLKKLGALVDVAEEGAAAVERCLNQSTQKYSPQPDEYWC